VAGILESLADAMQATRMAGTIVQGKQDAMKALGIDSIGGGQPVNSGPTPANMNLQPSSQSSVSVKRSSGALPRRKRWRSSTIARIGA